MQLKKQNKKPIIITVAIIAIVAIILVISAIVSSITDAREEAEGKIIDSIRIAACTKREYLRGEEFKPDSVVVQVNTKDMLYTYTVDHTQLSFSGFDSSQAVDEQVITVTYQEYSTTFTVKIVDPQQSVEKPTLVSIEVRDLHTTYTMKRWNENGPSLANAYLVLTYSDGTTKGSLEETPLLWKYVEPLSDVEGAGTTQMVINYTEGEGEDAITVSTTVTITITE